LAIRLLLSGLLLLLAVRPSSSAPVPAALMCINPTQWIAALAAVLVVNVVTLVAVVSFGLPTLQLAEAGTLDQTTSIASGFAGARALRRAPPPVWYSRPAAGAHFERRARVDTFIPLVTTRCALLNTASPPLSLCPNAGGALLAAAFFLIQPMSFRLIGNELTDESEASTRYGIGLIAGFASIQVLDVVIATITHAFKARKASSAAAAAAAAAAPAGSELRSSHSKAAATASDVEEAADSSRSETDGHSHDEALRRSQEIERRRSLDIERRARSASARKGVRSSGEYGSMAGPADDEERSEFARESTQVSVLVGDAVHNFAHGVFIASAFKLCSSTVGWVVVLATVAHKLSQELADFVLLTTVGGLRPLGALALKGLAGMLMYAGAITLLAVDGASVGIVLALAGGIYLHNGAAEAVPRMAKADSWRLKALALGFFVLGAVAMGSVLFLQRDNCDLERARDLNHGDLNHTGPQ
jgi:zinc transporter ZupT